MATDESRSPTFDGNETAEQSGQTADVSGIRGERSGAADQTDQEGDQPKRPDEAAQIVP